MFFGGLGEIPMEAQVIFLFFFFLLEIVAMELVQMS